MTNDEFLNVIDCLFGKKTEKQNEKPKKNNNLNNDLINRGDLLQSLYNSTVGRYLCSQYGVDKIIKDVPSVTTEQCSCAKWIPVETKLPPYDEEVIVSVVDDTGDTSYEFTTVAWHYNGIWISDNLRIHGVVAWMPLPKPMEKTENKQ